MKKPHVTEAMYKKSYPDIERIIWNKPAVIVFLRTGEKGISKVQPGDRWNRELGFWVAYAKAMQEKDKPYRKIANVISQCCKMVELGLKAQQHRAQKFRQGGLVSRVGEQGPERILSPTELSKFKGHIEPSEKWPRG